MPQKKDLPKQRKFKLDWRSVGAVLLAFAVFGVVAYAVNAQNISDGKKQFEQATERRDYMMEQVTAGLPRDISSDTKEICYMSEQGPYDKGRLWCQTSRIFYYNTALDKEATVAKSRAVAVDKGWTTDASRVADFTFSGAKDVPCGLSVLSKRFATSPGDYFSGDPAAESAVAIVCRARSQSRYYDFAGN